MKLKKAEDRIQELIELVEKLNKKIEDLEKQIIEKDNRIKDLKNRLNKNSQNSSRPPSTDFFKKTKGDRIRTGKKTYS